MAAHFFTATAISVAISIVLSIGWFLVSIKRNRNDTADIAWPTYFVAIALVTFALNDPFLDFRFIPLVLVALWGWRLFRHIRKRQRSHGEDSRYQEWKDAWISKGKRYFRVRSFLQVFLLQSLLAAVIALPVTLIQTFGADDMRLVPFLIGFVIWIAGFVFETTADRQLRKFLAARNPNGDRIMKKGLWTYSRHPNYFGEALQWWGLWIISIGLPFWWLAVIGPITITYLLRFVSGVPLAERNMHGDVEFEAYKARTNALVPWFKSVDLKRFIKRTH